MQVMRKRMTIGEINELLIKGWTQQAIADHFGVSFQAVSNMRHRYETVAYWSPREIALREAWPWKVLADQTRTNTYKNCRNHLEFMSTDGVGMSDAKIKRLRGFYKFLKENNVVVEYDPTIPPIDGVSGTFGGWAYRPRVESDSDLIIRVNEHTEMTEEAWVMWTFPAVEP